MKRTLITFAALCLALVLTFLLTGCTGLTKVADVSQSDITWIKVNPATCGTNVAPAGGWFNGCAHVQTLLSGNTRCTIVMEEDSADWVIAHEFRHCMGYAHVGGTR